VASSSRTTRTDAEPAHQGFLGGVEAPDHGSATPLALRVRNVSVEFGGIRALDDVSFVAEPATTLAVVGPNGAGKTTLLNTICGVSRRAARGSIQLGGMECLGRRPLQMAQAGIGRSFQHPPLIDGETVLQNVLVGAHLHMKYGMAKQVFLGRRVRAIEEEFRARAMATLAMIGSAKHADEVVARLPFGKRKLIDIARALMVEPRILLLDEPTSGLDRAERGHVQELIGALRDSGRVTVILVEHHFDVVRAVAQQVVGLEAGRVAICGTPDAVLDSGELLSHFLGGDRSGQGGSDE
jgi:ABC-type branched-subunit amino acid transport system ATPase component